VTDQELIDQIDRPKDVVYDKQNDGMVIIPADHQGIDAQDPIYNAGVPLVHSAALYKLTKKRNRLKINMSRCDSQVWAAKSRL
jgi:hypothetical protein